MKKIYVMYLINNRTKIIINNKLITLLNTYSSGMMIILGYIIMYRKYHNEK